ncbi:major facilitator superfamily domain-containing protein [Zychaea mexicana]|uniref:major facilitator superfamily domain-containing protein n=1 Tax=Zychaea mexicana TaxID=64656 RepID=UPI0022FE0313|nr:major facilitator superfamily domain-containing protein [Zychaea mexicana]KAI9496133.1 major facilitator superfamily domain-containing protein [Zychaea mexicana]
MGVPTTDSANSSSSNQGSTADHYKPTAKISSPAEDQNDAPYIDPVVQKRLVRKLDMRMLIWSFLAYFANLLDRNNLQNAFTMGMEEDLDLNSSVYNWAVTMFFIGYIVLQIPGNIIITKFSPRLLLPSVVITWGAVVSFMALIQDYKSLWGLRLCLGLAEAAFYPGMIFLLGSWYTKEELGKRTMFFATGNQVSGAFGGLIAGGIADTMHGAGGLPAWKWLFIIEGLIGVVIGVLGFFLLPNFPHNTKWLTEEERVLAVTRVQTQGKQVVSNAYNWRTVANVMATPYSWLMIINFACIYIGNNMSLNFAIILRDMGYPVSFSNYMNTPAYIFGAVIAIAIGWSSDKTGDRAFHVAGTQLWVGIWFLILAVVNKGDNPAALVFAGTYAITANISMTALCLAWSNEIYRSDHNTRAVAIAFINAIGNLAPNFVNVRAWVVSDSPDFWLGKATSAGMSFASVALTIFIWFLLRIQFMVPKAVENEKSDAVEEESSVGGGSNKIQNPA